VVIDWTAALAEYSTWFAFSPCYRRSPRSGLIPLVDVAWERDGIEHDSPHAFTKGEVPIAVVPTDLAIQ
jgi:hypothetical protein